MEKISKETTMSGGGGVEKNFKGDNKGWGGEYFQMRNLVVSHETQVPRKVSAVHSS